MLNLLPGVDPSRPVRLLCIGAHSDDLEIGCAGTLLSWLESSPLPVHVTWLVLTAQGERALEARRSARALLRRAAGVDIVMGSFEDGYLPAQYHAVKEFVEAMKVTAVPDIIFTHRLEDRHQDHRLVSELTWNTWRNHVILEYEILKYEGDLGQPNVFIPLKARIARRKAAHLQKYFGSQRSKEWFTSENFLALARLRGLECRAADRFAEAFCARKIVLAPQLGASQTAPKQA
jgi:LmbE family N-acetylglucosaminyl deacetylase